MIFKVKKVFSMQKTGSFVLRLISSYYRRYSYLVYQLIASWLQFICKSSYCLSPVAAVTQVIQILVFSQLATLIACWQLALSDYHGLWKIIISALFNIIHISQLYSCQLQLVQKWSIKLFYKCNFIAMQLPKNFGGLQFFWKYTEN